MLQPAPFGRELPLPPAVFPSSVDARGADDDLRCASSNATPRAAAAVAQLAGRVLTATTLAKYWIAWAGVSLGLWVAGTAAALVITKLVPGWGSTPILALGFGGLGAGAVSGYLWIRKRRSEAQTIAREGQLVLGTATFLRSQETFGGELNEILGTSLGETYYCVVFTIGFIPHQVWVAFPSPPAEGERHHVLVQPGARLALVFDSVGRGYVGELRRIG